MTDSERETPENPTPSADDELATGMRLPVYLAAAGLLVSAYLEWVHVRAYTHPSVDSVCTLSEGLDCAAVALSRFAVFGGVPMPVWGVFGFGAMLMAAAERSRLLLWLSGFATLASVALLAEELFFIGSVCVFCEAVHVLCLAIFVLAWLRRDRLRKTLTKNDVSYQLGVPALLWVLASTLIPPYWGLVTWKNGLDLPQGVTEEGYPWYGAENPEVVVHEFTDYRCPHCRVGSGRMKMRLLGDASKIRVVRRQWPRLVCKVRHEKMCELPRAAYCAQEQGSFWVADDWLFQHASDGGEFDSALFASDLSLDHEALSACIQRPDIYERAQAETQASRDKGVRATPSYMIDGELLEPDELRDRLDGL